LVNPLGTIEPVVLSGRSCVQFSYVDLAGD